MISPAKRAFTEMSKIVVCERVSGMREFVLLSGMYYDVVDEYDIEYGVNAIKRKRLATTHSGSKSFFPVKFNNFLVN